MCDEDFMQAAIDEAKKGIGQTGPNPIVGAVIVEEGAIVSKGFYETDGGPHAEVNAINHLGRTPLENAQIFVTLEPCSTHGRTGACTDAILKAGIKEVVLGAIDPNPDHQGKGIDILKEAGVVVRTGMLEQECTDLNTDYNQRMQS